MQHRMLKLGFAGLCLASLLVIATGCEKIEPPVPPPVPPIGERNFGEGRTPRGFGPSTGVAVSGSPGTAANQEKFTLEPGTIEVRFHDQSRLKLAMSETTLDVLTPFGRLKVPISEVHSIEFATPAPVVGNKKEEKIGDNEHQVLITTDTMKIAGKLEVSTFKVRNPILGDQVLKLADVSSIRTGIQKKAGTKVVNVLPDPGSLYGLQNVNALVVGDVLHIRVTGGLNGSVWGTDVYTGDSTLATVAVHAGAVQNGETGIVEVRIVTSPASFAGTNRNGVTTGGWGTFPIAFEISRVTE